MTYDTAFITQSLYKPSQILKYSCNILETQYTCYTCCDDNYGNFYPCEQTINTDIDIEFLNIALNYPTFESQTGGLKVKVVPDDASNSYILPSHDLIQMGLDAPAGVAYNFVWQYSIGTSNTWINFANGYNLSSISLNAITLLGANYAAFLGQTVKIRASYFTSTVPANLPKYSFVSNFTIRLSSPHIENIIPNNLGCYGEADGSFKTKFDRALLPSEKINILLTDTVNQVNYSALNLTSSSLNANNEYLWTSELPAAIYQQKLIGKYNNIATYTGSPTHYAFPQITQPPKQRILLATSSDVICKGGNNGVMQVSATGGVGNYKYGIKSETDTTFTWKIFTDTGIGVNASPKIAYASNLKAGRYYFKIRDVNNCIVRDSVGNELIRYKDITEPAEELKVDLLDITPITSYDSINGAIRVKIKGGTPRISEPVGFPVLPYYHTWRDSATNNIINNFTLDTLGGKYETKISNLPQGTYYFEATDRYFSTDTSYDYQGCRIFLKVVLKKPAPLVVNILKDKPVRCTGRTDGVLKAVATGGVQIDSTQKYFFKWFKLVSGTFVQQASTDSFLLNIGIGQYKVEVLDKYNNFKASATYTLTEPTPLIANATTTQSTCYSNADGTALGTATGGTMPYYYQWSNSDLTPLMDSVPGGNYILLVTDSLGCESIKQVAITSPIDMQTNITTIPVKCNNESNGAITVVPSGGTAPYQYTWSTGAVNVNNIQNLAAGRYWLRTKDNNNCTKTDTLNIINPTKYNINAGPDRVVCPSQTIPLTATIVLDSASVVPPVLTYQWVGPVGFSTSTLQTVNTLRPGTYFLNATNTTGCIKRDTLIVTYNAASAVPEFIVSTQAYVGENVLLANLSNPVPDSVKGISI